MRHLRALCLFAALGCGRASLTVGEGAVVDSASAPADVATDLPDVPSDTTPDVPTAPPPLEGPPCALPPSAEPPCKTPPCADEVLFDGMEKPTPAPHGVRPDQARLLATDGKAVYFVVPTARELYRFDPVTRAITRARFVQVLGTVLLGTKENVIWQDPSAKLWMGPWNVDSSTLLFEGSITQARLGGGRLYLLVGGVLRWGALGDPLDHAHPREVVSFTADDEYAYAVVADSSTSEHLERIAADGTTTLLGPPVYQIGAIEVVGDHLVGAQRNAERWCKRRYGAPDVFTRIGLNVAADRISTAGPFAYVASEFSFPNRPIWRMDLSKTVPGVDAAHVTVGIELYDQLVFGDHVYSFRWDLPSNGQFVRTLR